MAMAIAMRMTVPLFFVIEVTYQDGKATKNEHQSHVVQSARALDHPRDQPDR